MHADATSIRVSCGSGLAMRGRIFCQNVAIEQHYFWSTASSSDSHVPEKLLSAVD